MPPKERSNPSVESIPEWLSFHSDSLPTKCALFGGRCPCVPCQNIPKDTWIITKQFSCTLPTKFPWTRSFLSWHHSQDACPGAAPPSWLGAVCRNQLLLVKCTPILGCTLCLGPHFSSHLVSCFNKPAAEWILRCDYYVEFLKSTYDFCKKVGFGFCHRLKR